MTNKPAVVYSNVWEDPELNRLALKVKPGWNVLSITSGGCNSLCLLLDDPAKVVSIDMNPAQLAVLEFKRAAIMELGYEDFLESIGVSIIGRSSGSADHRLELYARIKHCMPDYAVKFWDEHQNQIKSGIQMCGKVEGFFRIYRTILCKLYSKEKIDALFSADTIEEQCRLYSKFSKKRWNFLHKLLLNRFVLSIVKGAHSFKQVDFDDYAENINKKRDYAMTHLLNRENYFMSLILRGVFTAETAMSPYLLRENFDKLKANIGKLEIVCGTTEDTLKKYGRSYFDALNLSNIFEWMPDEMFNAVMRDVIAMSRPGARMAWRYTFARPRKLDAKNLESLVYEPELSEKLFRQDRAFIYESFHVYHLREE